MHKVCLDICVTSVVADRVEFDEVAKMLWIVMYILATGQWPNNIQNVVDCLSMLCCTMSIAIIRW